MPFVWKPNQGSPRVSPQAGQPAKKTFPHSGRFQELQHLKIERTQVLEERGKGKEGGKRKKWKKAGLSPASPDTAGFDTHAPLAVSRPHAAWGVSDPK